jgi:hypothetical protein
MASYDSSGAVSGAAQGAATGAILGSVVPGIDTAVGAVAGGILGGIGGLFGSKKYKAPNRASSTVYGYDMYGNLVNKGSYKYNSGTGQYELTAGELSGAEKELRGNLAQNIAGLINTVGSTPDAFVRYAKELSRSYQAQGERALNEQYDRQQRRLDESLARRGLSTSRAGADISGELQRQEFNALQNLYDQAQQYGFNAQQALQNQARGALSTLGGYQSNLMNADQSYLSQALNTAQLGQQYENAKARVANQNTQMANTGWQNALNTFSDIGALAGYYMGSQGGMGGATGGTSLMANPNLNLSGTTSVLPNYTASVPEFSALSSLSTQFVR